MNSISKLGRFEMEAFYSENFIYMFKGSKIEKCDKQKSGKCVVIANSMVLGTWIWNWK